MTLPTRRDIGGHRELKTSATEPELILRFDYGFPMSGNVGSVIFWSGMVDNVGVAVGIALKSVSVQTLFPLPVSTSGFVVDI
jgi:hypothetical protein